MKIRIVFIIIAFILLILCSYAFYNSGFKEPEIKIKKVITPVEETNNGICIDWRMNDGQGAAIEMYYGPGDTYIKTEIRTFGNGPECTFIKTYDTNHPLDIYQCVEIVYEAMKNLSTINNDTQIWNLTCANKEYQHIRQ